MGNAVPGKAPGARAACATVAPTVIDVDHDGSEEGIEPHRILTCASRRSSTWGEHRRPLM
jgi:hypothetical protein